MNPTDFYTQLRDPQGREAARSGAARTYRAGAASRRPGSGTAAARPTLPLARPAPARRPSPLGAGPERGRGTPCARGDGTGGDKGRGRGTGYSGATARRHHVRPPRPGAGRGARHVTGRSPPSSSSSSSSSSSYSSPLFLPPSRPVGCCRGDTGRRRWGRRPTPAAPQPVSAAPPPAAPPRSRRGGPEHPPGGERSGGGCGGGHRAGRPMAGGYEKVPVILVGNKVDLESEREVSLSEGRALAEEWGCPFMETSAKSKTMVDELFAEIVRQMNYAAQPDKDDPCCSACNIQ
ncbi:ras-related protein Rap-2a isoform X1 [Zonotrichia albicollis]|uniref:ras-related protein Rap-2a isoform X1 n=1 Tax=Zonotrichia albicollis TaxID=44394 RepID=UPI003D811602